MAPEEVHDGSTADCLDSPIDETLATSNAMTKELSASDEGVIELTPIDPEKQQFKPVNHNEEKKKNDGVRKQNAMVNIPELETDSVERTILHIAPLVATGNYMNDTNLDLDNRFNHALNTLDMFNPVNFSQCALQGVMDLQMATNNNLVQGPYLELSPPAPEPTRVSAYAKLIFEDGYFYMNTYSVVLGRDLQAWHAAIRKEKRKLRQLRCNGANAKDIEGSAVIKSGGSRYTRSIVSESGGILRAGNDTDTEERVSLRRLRKRNKASKISRSTRSSSPSSKRDSTVQSNKVKLYEAQNLQSTISQADGPVPVDPTTFRPSPHDCPLVAIHPPATAPISAYKSISREHVKIAFNSRKNKFEAHIIGRNGCFVQDQWYHTNDVVSLQSGDFLQVGGITVQFMLPNQLDPTTTEYSEHSDHSLNPDKSPDRDESTVLRDGTPHESSENDSDSHADYEKSCDESFDNLHQDNEIDSKISEKKDEAKVQGDGSVGILSLRFDRKRGPGRPPKNGMLSKREQKLLKKEDQVIFEEMVRKGIGMPGEKDTDKENSTEKEKEKGKSKSKYYTSQTKPNSKDILVDSSVEKSADESTENAKDQQPDAPIKNKVGRPRKNPLSSNIIEPPREKRKYTKRKSKELKDGDLNETKSAEDVKSKKEKVSSRLLRSPSPVMHEEDFTPEQLAKPQANYVTLIHEAISNAPSQQLALPDIYRAICRKYPYFKFRTQTLGWQSSVRHNLSQHHAFRKMEKDGKGWTWGIVDGISIEKERKKRGTPPPQLHLDHPHQHPYQAGSHELMGHFLYGASPGYQNIPHGQYPHCNPPRISEKDSSATDLPPNFTPSIPLHITAPSVSKSYHSPYAPKPAKIEDSVQSVDQKISSNLNPEKTRAQDEEYPAEEDETHSNSHQIEQQEGRLHFQGQPSPRVSVKDSNQDQDMTRTNAVDESNISLATKSFDFPSHEFLANQELSKNSNSNHAPTAKMINTLPNEDILHAAEAFKKNLLDSLKSKQSEIIVNSAIDRVLGFKLPNDSQVNPQEEMIMSALRSLLSKIPRSGIEADPTKSIPHPENQSSDVTALSSQGGLQNNQSTNKTVCDGSTLAVIRPNFTVNRPSMTMVSSKTTNLESSNPTLSRKSAPSVSSVISSGSVNEVNTERASSKKNDQVTGQKRPFDDADEIRDFKKLATSRPPQLKT